MTSAFAADLAADTRDGLALLWHQRARSESHVHAVFTQLAADLAATGAHPEVIALALRAVDDEARHAASCQALAVAYGAPTDVVAVGPVRLPEYVDDPRLRAALHAANHCCIGETIASAFVASCLDACADPALREIHRDHLADEIRHARVGWAHLPTLTAAERAQVAGWLPELLRAQLAAWESRIADLPEAGFPGHGYPPRAALLATVHAAVTDVVLPGFAHVAVDATAATRWYAGAREAQRQSG